MNTTEQILDDFSFLDSWEDKYEYIIELGKNVSPLSAEEKIEKNIVHGCQSNVWIVPEIKDGRLYIKADSDALITKGILALLILLYSGQTIEGIKKIDAAAFLQKLGLEEHLSPARKNGLHAMIS